MAAKPGTRESRLVQIHREVRRMYLAGAGFEAFDLMLDLERHFADEQPLKAQFRARYRKLCRR